mmetsp:Transcript_25781/g.60183  ORF Transcript_25781/g.60183 Transcript_25781/m.60183 type:complete len:248 (-) Transcript_25781:565-1308(-)
MLYADKRALETNLKVSLLAIREKELNFYVSNCQSIGTQAAMLAGFAFAGLMQPLPPEPEVLRVLFLMSTVSALGLQLVTVVTTTLLSMLAPGLALRGPDGAMHAAVDGMIDEYRLGFYTFLFGLLFIHGAAIFFVWLAFPLMEAVVLTTCLMFSLFMMYRYIRKMFVTFALPKDTLDSGKFEGAEAVAAGMGSGVNDAGEISTISSLILQEQQLVGATALYHTKPPPVDPSMAVTGGGVVQGGAIVE